MYCAILHAEFTVILGYAVSIIKGVGTLTPVRVSEDSRLSIQHVRHMEDILESLYFPIVSFVFCPLSIFLFWVPLIVASS